MKLTKAQEEKLVHYATLEQCFLDDYEAWGEEFHKVQAELVAEYMPLIARLVESGLIEVCISDVPDIGKAIAGQGSKAYENGNIWIEAETITTEFAHAHNSPPH